jgi:hypothetical protein
VGLFLLDEIREGEQMVNNAHEDDFVGYFDHDELELVVRLEIAVAEDVQRVEEGQERYLNGT